MLELDVMFDPEVDGLSPKIIGGTFPANIVDLEEGREHDGSIPHNVVYRIAPEAAEVIGKDLDTGEEAKGAGMIGQEVKGVGIWLCPNPPKGQGWKNRGYIDFANSVGIKFPEVEDKITGKVKFKLAAIEKIDVLGLPVMVTIGQQVHKEDLNKDPLQQRKYPRAFKTLVWEDGERLDVDTLLAGAEDKKEEDPFKGV